jgi:hypothetical protein
MVALGVIVIFCREGLLWRYPACGAACRFLYWIDYRRYRRMMGVND